MQEAERGRAAELGASRQAETRAAVAAEAERRLGASRVVAASRLRQTETEAAEAAQRLDALEHSREQIEGRIQIRAAEMAPLLTVIERLSRFPAETLLAAPTDPDTALTGVLVLRGIARELEADAADLRREQQALEGARASIAAEKSRLAAARATQAAQAADLDRQLVAASAGRRQADAAADAAARHAAEFSARAESLRGVIAALETERRAAETRAQADAARAGKQRRMEAAFAARSRQQALATPTGAGTISPAARAGGQLVVPVIGPVVRHWGDPADGGPATGMTFKAPPGARVVAPCGGRVVFGQPFRSFGLLMIVDCGGGYHAVLSGLERLDAAVGQSVQSGEPVGVMPSGKAGELYVELRTNGQAVNPAPWLRAKLSNPS